MNNSGRSQPNLVEISRLVVRTQPTSAEASQSLAESYRIWPIPPQTGRTRHFGRAQPDCSRTQPGPYSSSTLHDSMYLRHVVNYHRASLSSDCHRRYDYLYSDDRCVSSLSSLFLCPFFFMFLPFLSSALVVQIWTAGGNPNAHPRGMRESSLVPNLTGMHVWGNAASMQHTLRASATACNDKARKAARDNDMSRGSALIPVCRSMQGW